MLFKRVIRFSTSPVLVLSGVLTTFSILAAQESTKPFPWRFVELAELDTENPDAEVGEFGAVTVDEQGNVYLLDQILVSRSGRTLFRGIHKFGPDGEWICSIGRQGEGPGEFLSADLIDVSANGELLILDYARGNLLIRLSAEGEYLSSCHIPAGHRESISLAGREVYWLVSIYPQPVPDAFLKPLEQKIELLDNSGNEIWSQQYSDITSMLLSPIEGRPNTAIPFPNPAASVALWTFDTDGAAWILSPDYNRLIAVNPNGRIVEDLEVNLPTLSLSSSELRDFMSERTERFRNSGYEQENNAVKSIERVIKGTRGEFSPVQRFWYIGHDGFLVDRVPVDIRAGSWREGTGRYLALFSDGGVSMEAEGPGGLVAVDNGYAIGLRTDPRELPRLILYRIERID